MKYILCIWLCVLCLVFSLGSLGHGKPKNTNLPKPEKSKQPAKIENKLTVNIEGLSDQALKNAQARINQRQKSLENELTAYTINRFYQSMPQDIKTAIAPYGYFKSTVHSSIQQSGNNWTVTIKVNPGPQLKFTTLNLRITGSGSGHKAFRHYYQNFPIKAGAPFNTEKYEEAKQGLFEIASHLGYFQAKMTVNKVVVDLNNYTSHVTIAFNTGPRYLFGCTKFNATPFRESFLRRFLKYKKGKYYNSTKVEKSRLNFTSTNYFSQVIVLPKIQQSKNLTVPIDIQLIPSAQREYVFGAGYGTDTGPRLLAGLNYNWVNAYGHRFNSWLRASQRNSELLANYIIPGPNPATDQLMFTLGYANVNQSTGIENSLRAITSYQTIFYGWQFTASITALLARSKITSDTVTSPNSDYFFLYPTLTLQRRSTDKTLSPTKGYNILFTTSGTSHTILSSSSYWQTRLNTKFLYTIFKGTRFIVGADFGYTDTKNFDDLPLSLNFWIGGAQTLRGFRYNTIGPGKELFSSTFEIQQRIYGDFYIAGFIDAGNVTKNSIFTHKLRIGVGPALVYDSPIGVLELSVANAISSPNKPWLIVFSMGPLI